MFKKKLAIFCVSLTILIVYIFFDNFKGAYRHRTYCETFGGLKLIKPLRKNVGWYVDEEGSRAVASLSGVSFVRYKRDGMEYDLNYLGGDPTKKNSYQESVANESVLPAYKWQHTNTDVQYEFRLRKTGFEIVDLSTNELVIHYYNFEYIDFNSILGPSIVKCSVHQGRNANIYSFVLSEIVTAFEN